MNRTALASKPLNSIALYDADPASSLAFVKQKLRDAGVNVSFTGDEVKYLQRLGGRASDLESVRAVFVRHLMRSVLTKHIDDTQSS